MEWVKTAEATDSNQSHDMWDLEDNGHLLAFYLYYPETDTYSGQVLNRGQARKTYHHKNPRTLEYILRILANRRATWRYVQ